jgi:hypothetical protein
LFLLSVRMLKVFEHPTPGPTMYRSPRASSVCSRVVPKHFFWIPGYIRNICEQKLYR